MALSETYVVPLDFDPDAIDQNTGLPEFPIITFDSLIVGKTAAKRSDTGPTSTTVPEIEIHEFRVMQDQIARLVDLGKDRASGGILAYPGISGPEVITCDNTRYSPTHPDDRDRQGLVYSVPFYGDDGALRGIVSAVILDESPRRARPRRPAGVGQHGDGLRSRLEG